MFRRQCAMQMVTFCFVKGDLSSCEVSPFAERKVTLRKTL